MVTGEFEIKAKFQAGDLLVTSQSPGLPKLPGKGLSQLPLNSYLNYISGWTIDKWRNGWRAVGATFAGYEITVEMERFEKSQVAYFPIYLIQTTQLSYPEIFPQELAEKLKEPIQQAGWAELATSKQLTDYTGNGCMVTLWTKDCLMRPSQEPQWQ